MTPLKAIEAFQEIWEFWPNQDDKAGSMTGLKYIATSQKLIKDKLVLAAMAYVSEVDVEYCHRLGNWMRDNHYLNQYSLDDADLKSIIKEATERTKQAETLIDNWNKCHDACDKFLPCLAIGDRLILVKKAMKNQFFRDNWCDALKKFYKLMSASFPDDDSRNYIKPTIQWFCTTSADKFSVARILEGEYGEPPRRKKPKPKPETHESEFSNPQDAINFFNNL